MTTCRHCHRTIVQDADGRWIDPEAGYDDENGDGIWRETCDAHDTFTAEHVPNDLPAGYRWATERETERHARRPILGMIVVHRTVDNDGVPYTQDEADLALPL
jgi:hypothetical protein